jgi:hypothetical protein
MSAICIGRSLFSRGASSAQEWTEIRLAADTPPSPTSTATEGTRDNGQTTCTSAPLPRALAEEDDR